MKKINLILVMVLLVFNLKSQININPDSTGAQWIAGGIPMITQNIIQEIESIPKFSLNPLCLTQSLPDSIDNSIRPYMRSIFRQSGNSCSQASSIGYMFTYEFNYLNGISADEDSTTFHPSFTYNFLNYGSEDSGSYIHHGLDILSEMGCPSIETYGAPIDSVDPKSWLTGCSKYYEAIQHRIKVYETIDLVSDSGLFFIKHWLDSHNGQDSIGGLAVFGVKDMGGCIYETIEEGPHIGRSIIRKCIETDTTDSHALTIVGFNDSIRYDLNLDGSIDTNEYGAIKVANSWGLSIWPPNPDPDYKDGYCWIPYSLMQNDTFLLNENAYICHAINNQPEIVLYSKMTHPNRDTFALQLGFDTIAINQYFNQRPSVWTLTNHHAGSFPLTGFESPNDTLEICLDFTYQYNLYDCNN